MFFKKVLGGIAVISLILFLSYISNSGFPVIIGFAAFVVYGALDSIGDSHPIFKLVVLIGVLGFFTPSIILTMPTQLKNTLLKSTEWASYESQKTIRANNGYLFSLSTGLSRIQRYSPSGEFEFGWFYTNSKNATIGLTENDDIVVAIKHPRQIEVYSQEESQIREPIALDPSVKIVFMEPLYASEFLKKQGLKLQYAEIAVTPELSLSTRILIPFWHPFIAFAITFFGIVLAKASQLLSTRDRSQVNPGTVLGAFLMTIMFLSLLIPVVSPFALVPYMVVSFLLANILYFHHRWKNSDVNLVSYIGLVPTVIFVIALLYLFLGK